MHGGWNFVIGLVSSLFCIFKFFFSLKRIQLDIFQGKKRFDTCWFDDSEYENMVHSSGIFAHWMHRAAKRTALVCILVVCLCVHVQNCEIFKEFRMMYYEKYYY